MSESVSPCLPTSQYVSPCPTMSLKSWRGGKSSPLDPNFFEILGESEERLGRFADPICISPHTSTIISPSHFPSYLDTDMSFPTEAGTVLAEHNRILRLIASGREGLNELEREVARAWTTNQQLSSAKGELAREVSSLKTSNDLLKQDLERGQSSLSRFVQLSLAWSGLLPHGTCRVGPTREDGILLHYGQLSIDQD